MTEEAIKHCRNYAIEAERKLGAMLRKSERQKGEIGGRPRKDGKPSNSTLPGYLPPTLSDLGLTKRESAEAQLLADLPVEDFEKIKAGKSTIGQAMSHPDSKNLTTGVVARWQAILGSLLDAYDAGQRKPVPTSRVSEKFTF